MLRRRAASTSSAATRKLQLELTVITAGLWLLAPLTIWLWRTGRRRGAYVSGAVFSLIVILVIVGISLGGKTSAKSGTASGASADNTAAGQVSASTHAADDAQAKADIARALKVVASDYQDFGDYSLLTPYTLGNLDHVLRKITSLKAHGQESRSRFPSHRPAERPLSFAATGLL